MDRAGLDLANLTLENLLMQRRSLRRQLSARENLQPIRIAVLSGSTTNELVNLLELWLLESGFSPLFYQTEYGRFHEEAVYEPQAIIDFQPDIVYVHTSVL